MFSYDGQICPVCGLPFDKDSDIVVCPDCGTPHHRRCWDELGHCANRDKHRQGFEWKPVIKEPPRGTIPCPNCGAFVPQDSKFCENCGKPLPRSQPQSQTNESPWRQSGTYTVYRGGVYANPENDEFAQRAINRVEQALAGEIDGVPVRDMAVYIGPNSQYYIYKFRRMDQNRGYKPFVFSAFLFSPLWYMYRKMWKVARLSAIFNFIMNIPYLIVMANSMGLIASSSPLMFAGIESVANVCSLIVMLVGVYLGFKAVPLYRKSVTTKLKELKARSGGDSNAYVQMVLSQAGPSKIAMGIICILSIYYIIQVLF